MESVARHHVRKMDADDPFDTVSGTLGLTGAADTLLILKRQSGGVTLFAKGRDIEESETAIQFEKNTCRWTILGAAADVHRSAERRSIMDTLAKSDDAGLSVSEIVAAVEGSNRNAIEVLLHKMKEAEEVTVRRGVYVLGAGAGKIGQKERIDPQTTEAPTENQNLTNLTALTGGLRNGAKRHLCRISSGQNCPPASGATRLRSALRATAWTISNERRASKAP